MKPWMNRLLLLAVMTISSAVAEEVAPRGLQWDALEKQYVAKEGEEEAKLQFEVTNRSDHPIEILGAATSCQCTVATPPRHPWIIAPGAKEALPVTVDLRSRRGRLTKTIYLDTSEGEQMLQLHVEVPAPPALRREMNATLAFAEWRKRPAMPLIGKSGFEKAAAKEPSCPRSTRRETDHWTKPRSNPSSSISSRRFLLVRRQTDPCGSSSRVKNGGRM